ncbi:MurR/RpiR family transcriptional regulator [Niallia taxi]|nr:MurR/RpiR family transcriptional regulator [Niallia taxi]MDE5053222.1 MurR/RpiR family transcriptional regulator [Niallia taxi]
MRNDYFVKSIDHLFFDYSSERHLTNTEKEILLFLIRKKLENQTLSIRLAANELFVSTTTIIRLCKKLGFSGYSEFIYHLNLKASKLVEDDAEYIDEIHQPLIEAVETFKQHFEQTFDSLNEQSIERFIQKIKENNMIYFYGAGFSTLFANYLSKKFELFGYYVSNSSTSDSRAIFLNNIEKYRLLIVFSRSGNTQKVLEKVQLANDRGLTTILFTGNSKSATAEAADIVFTVLDPTIESQHEFEITSYESNMFMLIDLLLALAVKKGIITEY